MIVFQFCTIEYRSFEPTSFRIIIIDGIEIPIFDTLNDKANYNVIDGHLAAFKKNIYM